MLGSRCFGAFRARRTEARVPIAARSYFARANANRGIGFVDHLAHRQKTVDLALEANVRDAVSRFAEALGIDEAIVTQWIIAGGQHESRR